MPLFLLLAVIAIVATLALRQRQAGEKDGARFFGTAAALWGGLIVLALVILTVGTLIFGR